ncbi:hypothetical protein [Streptomyces sp. B1I3]|uniref:hypothetical protein n=1 Tax=Streptomyces sp. B1I3 TaxID=3042264 RepID=UPI0027882AB6|nr:hypothetical protein [Streptomyces sp. B1I3]MDQ0794987.1 hypothetical protein [Streptomyces sp. B1I3]
MRHMSARVRRAAVTALTIAVSTGCMSVGDDAGQPAPPRPSGRQGESAQPDGGTVRGTGRSGSGGGRAEAQSDRDASRRPDARPHPAGRPDRPGGTLPAPAPGNPEPTLGGHLPTPEPSAPGPGEPPPPPVSPEPPPSPPPASPEPSQQPPEQPSASPAAQFRSDALGPPGRVGVWPTPKASPQVAPV